MFDTNADIVEVCNYFNNIMNIPTCCLHADLLAVSIGESAFNLAFGWSLMIAGVLSGAILGLFFYRQDFMGGYDSFRRRIARLGHIACFGMGILNVLFALSLNSLYVSGQPQPACIRHACLLWLVGGVGMPLICFLSAWKAFFRHLFFIPVLSVGYALGAIAYAGFSA